MDVESTAQQWIPWQWSRWSSASDFVVVVLNFASARKALVTSGRVYQACFSQAANLCEMTFSQLPGRLVALVAVQIWNKGYCNHDHAVELF